MNIIISFKFITFLASGNLESFGCTRMCSMSLNLLPSLSINWKRGSTSAAIIPRDLRIWVNILSNAIRERIENYKLLSLNTRKVVNNE